eukprot:IDg8071t1
MSAWRRKCSIPVGDKLTGPFDIRGRESHSPPAKLSILKPRDRMKTGGVNVMISSSAKKILESLKCA